MARRRKSDPKGAARLTAEREAAQALGQLKRATDKLTASGSRRPAKIASAATTREIPAKPATKSRPAASSAIVTVNTSIPVARELREQLEPLGWTAHAKKGDQPNTVDFVANRESETITIQIENGKLTKQHYSIWDSERPSTNGMPKVKLPFDPDEMSDVELINQLAGQKVTWWNRLSKSKESGVLGHTDGRKIQIQHVITVTDGEADELPGSRIITFVDATPNEAAFKSFAVGALMKIG